MGRETILRTLDIVIISILYLVGGIAACKYISIEFCFVTVKRRRNSPMLLRFNEGLDSFLIFFGHTLQPLPGIVMFLAVINGALF